MFGWSPEASHREALYASCSPPYQPSGEEYDFLTVGKFGVPDAEGGRIEAELFGAHPVGLHGHRDQRVLDVGEE